MEHLKNYIIRSCMMTNDVECLPFMIRKSEIENAGRKVISRYQLKAGTPLFIYRGETISKAYYLNDIQIERNNYILETKFSQNTYAIVGDKSGNNFASICQHSSVCCNIRPRIESHKNNKFVMFYATKEIAEEEELVWNYNRKPSNYEVLSFPFLRQ